MIYKLEYSTNRSKYTEYAVPWADVWNGQYRDKFITYYKAHRETYKVAEFSAGLVITIPVADANLIEAEIFETKLPKTKVKIKEVFKTICQR